MPLPIALAEEEAETMTSPFDSADPEDRNHPSDHTHREPSAERNIPLLALIVGVVALVVAVVAIVLVLDDGDTTETLGTTTTVAAATTTLTTAVTTETTLPTTATTAPSTTAESTTVESTTTDPTTTIDPAAYRSAVWPWPSAATGAAAQRFDDPVAAATSFAVDFVGFTDPVVGEYQAGDNRSGEVEVRNREDGPATTVFVRQLGADDTWWVLGSATGDILIDQPEAMEVIGTAFEVRGAARTFEGNVEVILRGDGLTDPIFTGNVTGRGDGTFGSFDESFAVDSVAVDSGSALFLARSAKDGSVWQASIIRVLFNN